MARREVPGPASRTIKALVEVGGWRPEPSDPALDPDLGDLRAAIERLADDSLRAELAAGAVRVRDTERRWADTVADLGELLESGRNG